MKIIDGDAGSQVEVSLVNHPKIIGQKLIQVRLCSTAKANLKSTKVIDPKTEDNIHVRVICYGAELAEYQNEAFKDTHDPRACGNAAGNAFKELMAKLEEQVIAQRQ